MKFGGSTDGSSWSIQDSANDPACVATGFVSLAIDSSDILHFAYPTSSTVITYNTMDTSDNLYDTAETAFTASNTSVNLFGLALDSNNISHLVVVDF